MDIIDQFGRISQKYANPSLRDNEWVVATEIDRAEKARKGLVILGIRLLPSLLLRHLMCHMVLRLMRTHRILLLD